MKSRKAAKAKNASHIIVPQYSDPFSYLSSLTGIEYLTGSDDEDVLLKGKELREGGKFDLDFFAKEIDIAQMVQSIIDDNTLIPKDVKIDDSSMPLAKNFLEWTTQNRFAGTVMTPFLEQLCWGVVAFAEWCPRCSDNLYLFENHKVTDTFDKFKSKVQLLEHGVCPACKGRKSEFVRNGEMKFYQELAVNAGQRSGKSACVGGMLAPYLTHRILKLQKPNDVYGLAASNMLHGTFVALTYAQAKETLWEFYYGTLTQSQWFQEYHAMLRKYEELYGQSLLKFNDTFVVYRPRSLMVYPAGPDKRTLRGRTRSFFSVDEIGWFDNGAASNKVKTSAREVYIALDRSLLTVRGSANKLIVAGHDNIPNGMAMNVSSPASQRDKICELVRQAQTSESMYGIHRPTWEVNPTLPRNSPVIVEEYRKDPVGAERDYGANPPLSANPFLSNHEYILRAFRGKKNGVLLQGKVRNKKKQGSATKWAEIVQLKKSKKGSIMAIDAGYSNNSFACALGYVDEDDSLVTNLLVEIMPEPGIPLNYTMIYENVLGPIIQDRNVKVVLADRWNSLKLLQDMENDYGLTVAQYSLKYKDLGLTKSYLEANSLVFPKLEVAKKSEDIIALSTEEYPRNYEYLQAEHLAMQMMTVQDTGSGVIKGDGLTDDLWRAVCLLVWGLSQEQYSELLVDAAPEDERFRPAAIAVSKLGRGGGVSIGSGGGGISFNGVLGSLKRGR